jgi:hypothetical protein
MYVFSRLYTVLDNADMIKESALSGIEEFV